MISFNSLSLVISTEVFNSTHSVLVFEKYFLGNEWMNVFEKIWNSKENTTAQEEFLNIGEVMFAIDPGKGSRRATTVRWDQDGKIIFTPEMKPQAAIPFFTAPPSVWESVIYDYYSTIQAVVNRKMEFEGKMKFALQFSKKFPLIADVAILVNHRFMQL